MTEIEFQAVFASFHAVPAAERVNETECQEQLKFRLTGSQKKTAYCIRYNVEKMLVGNARQHLEWRKMPDGRNKRVWVCDAPANLNCAAFLTLTVGDSEPGLDGSTHFRQVWDAAEANRRINNLNRRVLSELFERWILVTERHKSGAIHFHAVGILKGRPDIRTGFNFDAVRRKNYASVSPALLGIWANLREVLPGYGFGRSELTPIEKTSEQIASYVSKYIEKNLFARRIEDKRKKLVRYGGWQGEQLKPNCISWAGEQARQWRYRSRICGAVLGTSEREQMAEFLGPRWAFGIHKLIQWQETWPVPFWEMSGYEFEIFADAVKKKAREYFERDREAEVQSCRIQNELATRRYRPEWKPDRAQIALDFAETIADPDYWQMPGRIDGTGLSVRKDDSVYAISGFPA